MPGYRYQFPECIMYEDAELQGAKVVAEANEAIRELCMGNTRRAALELLDVIHAAETMLRHLPLTAEEVEDCRATVEVKNRVRGYYGTA